MRRKSTGTRKNPQGRKASVHDADQHDPDAVATVCSATFFPDLLRVTSVFYGVDCQLADDRLAARGVWDVAGLQPGP